MTRYAPKDGAKALALFTVMCTLLPLAEARWPVGWLASFLMTG